MIGFFSIIAIGFILGMRHATDPDHVIAVTTIVSRLRSTSKAAIIGAIWGLGHTVTIFVVGCLIILFNLVIPPRIGLTMELSVGLMLILLGVWNLKAFFTVMPPSQLLANSVTPHIHSHAHAHGDYVHDHPHGHAPESHSHVPEQTPLARLDSRFGTLSPYQFARPLIVGIVHGLAGSAAVTLLILATIRNPGWAIAYLLVFGIGTIAGMMLITMSLASTFRYFGNRFANLGRRFSVAVGLISMAFGIFLAYQICIVQGLLSAHPNWTPR